MTAATATTTRAHHSAATHSPRLNDKGQPLPDDGAAFAHLLAEGLDDNSTDPGQSDVNNTPLLSAQQTLSAESKPTDKAQTPDASADAALAAWIGQALAQHHGVQPGTASQDKADAAQTAPRTATPTPTPNVLPVPAKVSDASATGDDATREAKSPAGHAGAKPAAGHVLTATGSAHGKPQDGLPALASTTAQALHAAKVALNDATASGTPMTLATVRPDPSLGSDAGTASPLMPHNSTSATPSTPTDSAAPLSLVAAAPAQGGAQNQSQTGADGGNAQPSFQGTASAPPASTTGGADGAAGQPAAPTFSQALNQAFDALGAQVSFWSNSQVQRATMDLDTGTGDPLKVDVTLHEGKVHLDFKTDDSGTRDALHQNATAVLTDLLARNGIDLGGVSVGAQNSGRDNTPTDPGSPQGARSGLLRALDAAGTATTSNGTAQRLVRSDRALDLYA